MIQEKRKILNEILKEYDDLKLLLVSSWMTMNWHQADDQTSYKPCPFGQLPLLSVLLNLLTLHQSLYVFVQYLLS